MSKAQVQGALSVSGTYECQGDESGSQRADCTPNLLASRRAKRGGLFGLGWLVTARFLTIIGVSIDWVVVVISLTLGSEIQVVQYLLPMFLSVLPMLFFARQARRFVLNQRVSCFL